MKHIPYLLLAVAVLFSGCSHVPVSSDALTDSEHSISRMEVKRFMRGLQKDMRKRFPEDYLARYGSDAVFESNIKGIGRINRNIQEYREDIRDLYKNASTLNVRLKIRSIDFPEPNTAVVTYQQSSEIVVPTMLMDAVELQRMTIKNRNGHLKIVRGEILEIIDAKMIMILTPDMLEDIRASRAKNASIVDL